MAQNSILTTDEVLLLENLMYLPKGNIKSGVTIGQLLNEYDLDTLNDDKDYGNFMTGADWKNIITAVRQNDILMNIKIASTHIDNAAGGGEGVSAVFVNEQSGEAVVAFCGTAGREWKDNFVGGGATDATDGVSTVQQENALAWYQDAYKELELEKYSVTVTGHSKGGNKAKYITIMDDSVDRCVSFDGQGFSDEFIEKYSDRIAYRQDCIQNNNIDYDYVNLLLNDVGETTYYKGYDYGKGGFLENHCPNTFFDFKEDGTYSLQISDTGQAKEMKELDEFLNSCMRSMTKEEKAKTLDFIGEIVEGGFGGAGPEFFKDMLLDSRNEEIMAYLLAYTIEYGQANPDFINSIEDIMKEFGLGDCVKYVDIAETVINSRYFDFIYDVVDGVSRYIPNFIWDWLRGVVEEKLGIELSIGEIKQLIGIIGMVDNEMDSIIIQENSGADIRVNSAEILCKNFMLLVKTNSLQAGAEKLEQHINKMNNELDRILKVKENVSGSASGIAINAAIKKIERQIEQEQLTMKTMAEMLEKTQETYVNAERRISHFAIS